VLVPLTEQLEEIFNAYVMEHQRDTHDSIIGSGAAAKALCAPVPKPASNVELF